MPSPRLRLDRGEDGVHRGERGTDAFHPLPANPLRLLRRLLPLPLANVPLDLAEHTDLVPLVEVLKDLRRVLVLMPRQLRRELEPAARRASNRLFAGFDYPQNRSFRLVQFGLTMRMEAAGIEPASAAAPAERLQA